MGDNTINIYTVLILFRIVLVPAIIVAFFIFLRSILSKVRLINYTLEEKYSRLEKLLFDIRDGTKMFYEEMRHAPRFRENIKARFLDKEKDSNEIVEVLNISAIGALLKSKQRLHAEEIINIRLLLPIFPEPVDIQAKVVWAAADTTENSGLFESGIEFVHVPDVDSAKLKETLKSIDRGNNER